MSELVLPARFRKQSKSGVIDKANPLTHGLVFHINMGFDPAYDIVGGRRGTHYLGNFGAWSPHIEGMTYNTYGGLYVQTFTPQPITGYPFTLACSGVSMDTGDRQMIGIHKEGSSAIAYDLNLSSGGQVVVQASSASNWDNANTATAVNNVPFSLVGVFESATARYGYYKSGNVFSTGSSTVSRTFDSTCDTILVGAYMSTAGGRTSFFRGALYSPAVWNRALTPAEALAYLDNPFQLVEPTEPRIFAIGFSAGGGVTGTLSVTEASDTLASTAFVAISASAGLQEASDSLVSAAIVSIAAAGAIQELNDTLASDGTVAFPGTIGTAALTEVSDTLVASVSVVVTGTAAITEDRDVLGSGGAVSVAATASLSEAADTLAADGGTATFAIAQILESADSLAATGAASIAANGALLEAADSLSAAATVSVTAAATLSETGDLLSASGTVGTVVRTADASLQEVGDSLAASAVSTISASAAIIEAGDIVVSGVTLTVTGTAVLVEAADTLDASVSQVRFANAAMVETDDLLSATVVRRIARRIAASDSLAWTAAGSDTASSNISASDGLN